MWEAGARRSHPRYRPWSCEDCGGRRVNPCRRRSRCWCMVLGVVAFGGPYGLGSCMCPWKWWRATAPDPLVRVRVCTPESPGDTWRTRSPDGRCRQNSNGSSAEPVLSRVAGPTVLLQHPGWRSGDQSQRMGPRSHPLWEWRPTPPVLGAVAEWVAFNAFV